MELLKANQITRYENWSCLIYAEAGIGKTTMVKSLEGRTLVFSIDGMYHILHGLENVDVLTMEPKQANNELGEFYRFVLKNKEKYDNIVIDNLSTFQKFWLNEMSSSTTAGMPELKHYGIIDRILLDFIASLKNLNKNLLFFAHEKKVEITRENGGVYTQFQPDVRNLDAIMGIMPIVGRMVVTREQGSQERKRIIVLQPTRSTRAKDQLIGNLETIGQMDLMPLLQNKNN